MRDSHCNGDGGPSRPFILLGLAQAAVYVVTATGLTSPDRVQAALVAALLAFTLYAAAIPRARRLAGRRYLLTTLALGLFFRACFFFQEPLLSDDFFRYLWDGLVHWHGINPYQYAPADPALAGIADALRARVNHPTVLSIYPPLAQLAFAAAAIAGGGWLALKAIWLACDLGIALVLSRLVPGDRRLQALTIYWWSPLVVIEVAWNAHLDLLGVLPLVLALLLARHPGRNALGLGAALAAAALVKYFALLLVPAAGRLARPGRVAAVFAILVLASYAPYISAGGDVFAGLITYAESWRFHAGIFSLLNWLVGSPALAKLIAAAAVGLLCLQSVRNEWTLERAAVWITGAILVLSPTLHPWYLLWMVPLIALAPNRAWLYLTGSILLAYYGLPTFQAEGVWPEPWWIKLAIYAPFFALLIADSWRSSWWQAAWEEIRTERGARARSEPPPGSQPPPH
ncbi:MAG: hypothetical protein JSU87_00530 [Gemmatimonadota bacterium]|nr:MAG: hypothetical protein JSU87_00530 [Gemmatimonadota bacterium]